MANAVFVRESFEISDQGERLLLSFARRAGLVPGDTLILAARTVTASPGYVLDLRDPTDPAYLLNFLIVADTLAAPQLVMNLSGDAAANSSVSGTNGRSAEVYARSLAPISLLANGGAGATGVAGQPGTDGIVTQELDDRGKPRFDVEPPTPGHPGGSGSAGGAGGTAAVVWSEGPAPSVQANGGAPGLGGAGGAGGKGKGPPARPKPKDAEAGPPGAPGAPGQVGLAAARQVAVADLWSELRARYPEALAACGEHWKKLGEYRFRLVRGTPTAKEADDIVGLLDLAMSAAPGDAEIGMIRARFLNGENALGMPRNLDVVPDFERFLGRLEITKGPVDSIFSDAKRMLAAASPAELTAGQLQAQLASLESTKAILTAELADAEANAKNAESEAKTAAGRHDAIVDEINRKRAELESPVDWGGVVVIAMFTAASFLISAYGSKEAGKLVGAIPDLMVFGNLNFTGSAAETAVLKAAVSGGAKLKGLREAAEQKKSGGTGEISITEWVDSAGPVVISFAKFIKDLDEANADPALKALVKELAQRLQDRMAAEARRDQAKRRVEVARLRVEATTAGISRYADLHTRARNDTALLRKAALSLLETVQRYGDVFLGYQVQAARAVEIYTLKDQSGQMAVSRWHPNPDETRDYQDDIISPLEYQNRLIATETELQILGLVQDYDAFDYAGFQPDVHFITVTDTSALAAFRQQGRLTFTVQPGDLAGERWQAKIMEAKVTLQGVTAGTPSFAMVVTHSGRCSELLTDGTVAAQLLGARSTIIQVAANGAPGAAVGAGAGPPRDQRPTAFWRRSVATEWRLSIEPDVLMDRQVNLAGLTRVDIALSYLALAPAAFRDQRQLAGVTA